MAAVIVVLLRGESPKMAATGGPTICAHGKTEYVLTGLLRCDPAAH
jgi:hypothetical protein